MGSRRCECEPCTLPRSDGGRCPSYDTESPWGGGVVTSHCIPCTFCCFDNIEETP